MKHPPYRLDIARYPYQYELQTRYEDLDTLNHLNNAKIIALYETMRYHFSRWLQADAGDQIWDRLVLVQQNVSYIGQGNFPDPLTMAAGVLNIGNRSFSYGLAAFQNDRCIGICDTVNVLLDERTDKAVELGEEVKEKLRSALIAEES